MRKCQAMSKILFYQKPRYKPKYKAWVSTTECWKSRMSSEFILYLVCFGFDSVFFIFSWEFWFFDARCRGLKTPRTAKIPKVPKSPNRNFMTSKNRLRRWKGPLSIKRATVLLNHKKYCLTKYCLKLGDEKMSQGRPCLHKLSPTGIQRRLWCLP